MTPRYAIETSGWEVMWVAVRSGKKKIVAIDFEHDLAGALDLYHKIKVAGKPMATMRCKNVGFEPLDKYLGKMAAYNQKGVWWCPYCMQLRRFEKRNWAVIGDEIYGTEDEAYCCPMCDISHRDHHVVKWNPVARRLRDGNKRKRTSKGRKKRARRK